MDKQSMSSQLSQPGVYRQGYGIDLGPGIRVRAGGITHLANVGGQHKGRHNGVFITHLIFNIGNATVTGHVAVVVTGKTQADGVLMRQMDGIPGFLAISGTVPGAVRIDIGLVKMADPHDVGVKKAGDFFDFSRHSSGIGHGHLLGVNASSGYLPHHVSQRIVRAPFHFGATAKNSSERIRPRPRLAQYPQPFVKLSAYDPGVGGFTFIYLSLGAYNAVGSRLGFCHCCHEANAPFPLSLKRNNAIMLKLTHS
jgi:hypothetical protein